MARTKRMLSLAGRFARMELRIYQSTYHFLFRRPRVPAGAEGFSYHQPVIVVIVAITVLSIIEMVAVDYFVRDWPVVRWPLLILSVYGAAWMIGYTFGMLTRPHAVGPDGIRVRDGLEADLALSWDDIAAVGKRKRVREDKEPKVTHEDGLAILHLRISDETNIDVELEGPTRLRLPHGEEVVDRVALYADDPAGFLKSVRRHIG